MLRSLMTATSVVTLLVPQVVNAQAFTDTFPTSDLGVARSCTSGQMVTEDYANTTLRDAAAGAGNDPENGDGTGAHPDRGKPPTCSLTTGKNYGTYPSPHDPANNGYLCIGAGPNGCYSINSSVSPHELQVSNAEPPVHLIHKNTFAQDGYISMELEVEGACFQKSGQTTQTEDRCHFSLSMYNGEYNFHSIVLDWAPSQTDWALSTIGEKGSYALKNPVTGSDRLPFSAFQKLRVDYYGHEKTQAVNGTTPGNGSLTPPPAPGVKFAYIANGMVWNIQAGSACDTNGVRCGTEPSNNLFNPVDDHWMKEAPHLSLLWGSYRASPNSSTTAHRYFEGRIRNIRAYTTLTNDQVQSVQNDGVALSDQKWIGQYVAMGSGEVSAVRLFLVASEPGSYGSYTIEARKNDSGHPDMTASGLITRTNYTADRYGMQDVPLIVSQFYPAFWILVKGQSGTTSSIAGITSVGTKPYNFQYVETTDGGSTWTAYNQNLTFVTKYRS